MRLSIFYICLVKKTGYNASSYCKGIENIALSTRTAKPFFAISKNAPAISELLEYNELEIIYANIRV